MCTPTDFQLISELWALTVPFQNFNLYLVKPFLCWFGCIFGVIVVLKGEIQLYPVGFCVMSCFPQSRLKLHIRLKKSCPKPWCCHHHASCLCCYFGNVLSCFCANAEKSHRTSPNHHPKIHHLWIKLNILNSLSLFLNWLF